MWGPSLDLDTRTNYQLMLDLVKSLREKSAGWFGLSTKQPRIPILEDTHLRKDKKISLVHNAHVLGQANAENTVIFTGQCLYKEDEDEDCPVTLEDAIECTILKDLLDKHHLPTFCIYPDTIYYDTCKSTQVSKEKVDKVTNKLMAYRKKLLPKVIHLRLSELLKDNPKILSPNNLDLKISNKVRRVYGGRVLKEGETHSTQKPILSYGILAIEVPSSFGHKNKNIIVFGEGDEMCSAAATEIIRSELDLKIGVGFIGILPITGTDYPGKGKARMFSSQRSLRIHLNEQDEEIKRKLEEHPYFTLLTLMLSPLTTQDQFSYMLKTDKRNTGLEILMQQIKEFRKYL